MVQERRDRLDTPSAAEIEEKLKPIVLYDNGVSRFYLDLYSISVVSCSEGEVDDTKRLTMREWTVLATLLKNKYEIVSLPEMIAAIRSNETPGYFADEYENIRVIISNLRSDLNAVSSNRLGKAIVNVRGRSGYLWDENAIESPEV